MEISCNEVFLEDVVRVQVYPASAVSFPPVNIPGISRVETTKLPVAVLDLAYSDTEAQFVVRDGSIKVKQTQKPSGSGLIYIYNVDAVVEFGVLDLVEKVRNIFHADHHCVVTKADGTMMLLYALPNTFSIDQSNDRKELTLKIALSSLSSFIKLSTQTS